METYNCSCYPGWRGVNCTEDIDECKENIGMIVYSSMLSHYYTRKNLTSCSRSANKPSIIVTILCDQPCNTLVIS
jgi:hypothetical protein